jgi:hypothetical protein
MNRRHRRATAKQDQDLARAYAPDGVSPVVPIVAKSESRPGIGLRAVGVLLLSGWVLKRVQHPGVLGILADLARQLGRTDTLLKIHEKLLQPNR